MPTAEQDRAEAAYLETLSLAHCEVLARGLGANPERFRLKIRDRMLALLRAGAERLDESSGRRTSNRAAALGISRDLHAAAAAEFSETRKHETLRLLNSLSRGGQPLSPRQILRALDQSGPPELGIAVAHNYTMT